MEKLRVGICGYGIVGKKRRICVDSHPKLKLIAVCDKSFFESGVFQDGIKYYSDYKNILEEKLDILIVCMTNDIAADVVISALQKDLHVFCEKPPGRNMSDIQRVIKCIKRYPGLKLMYGFNHRYHYSVIDALSIIRSGNLGGIINMRGVYGKSKLVTFKQSDWRTSRKIAGGGVLLDQGIHMVDLMRLFAGEFIEVSSYVSNKFWGFDVEDNAYALMSTSKGVIAMLHSSATQWRHRFELEINLEKGALVLGGILSGTKSYGSETLKIIWSDMESDNGDPKEQTTLYNKDDSWAMEINEFVNSIISSKPIANGDIVDAYQTMKLVYKIYFSDPKWRAQYDIEDPDMNAL